MVSMFRVIRWPPHVLFTVKTGNLYRVLCEDFYRYLMIYVGVVERAISKGMRR